jgi:hypothetical protein
MDLKTYIKQCCEAWRVNPPNHQEGADDPERLRWLVRYYARTDGAGLAGYPVKEVNKYIGKFWDAYIKSFFASRHMKLMGDFSNKQLFAWILEAKAEAEAAGWDCSKAVSAAQQNMQRTVGEARSKKASSKPVRKPVKKAVRKPAQLPLM